MTGVPRTRRAIALVGNAVAIALIGLLLLETPRLFGTARPAPAPSNEVDGSPAGAASATGGQGGARLLFVVIDALRDDTARDATLMPTLVALADGGLRARWWVDLLVPSTVGALEALVEGRAPPPVAALRDFGAMPAPGGGWLERTIESGGEVFVAGPDLWTERYGAWITRSHVEAGVPSAAADGRVADAAREALGGDAPSVVVVHLAELDAAAHRHGAHGPGWRAAARRVDARLAEVLGAVGDGRAIVVVADHGVTRRGGHAGGETVVRRAPLVVANATDGGASDCELRDPFALALSLVSVDRSPDANTDADGAGAVPCRPSGAARLEPRPVGSLLAATLVAGALVTACAARSLSRGGVPGFALSAALWIALVLAASGRPEAGSVLAVAGAIAMAALATFRRAGAGGGAVTVRTRGSTPLAEPGGLGVPDALVAFAAGVALALAALGVALCTADAAPLALVPPWTLGVLAGLVAGFVAGSVRAPHAAGIGLAVAVSLAVHVGGETLSLSSVDVRAAHRVAGLAAGPAGIALAAPVALVRVALPIAAALVGLALGSARRRRRFPPSRRERHERALGLATAFAACQLGAATVYALCLSRPTDPATTGALPLAAAGLGGLLRECVSTALVFLSLAARGAAPAADDRGPAADDA